MQEDLKLKIFRASAAAKGIRHFQLAEMCNLSRSAFSLMINGFRTMPPEIEKKLIEALNLKRMLGALVKIERQREEAHISNE